MIEFLLRIVSYFCQNSNKESKKCLCFKRKNYECSESIFKKCCTPLSLKSVHIVT